MTAFHAYFDVDLDVIWQILSKDIPSLVKNLEGLLS